MFRRGAEDVVPADPEAADDLRLRDLHQHPGARLRLQVIIPYPVTIPSDDNTISSPYHVGVGHVAPEPGVALSVPGLRGRETGAEVSDARTELSPHPRHRALSSIHPHY